MAETSQSPVTPVTLEAPSKILFVPVSGPTGIGEYQRSLFIAQALLAGHPGWDVRMIVSEDAPYIDTVPMPVFRTSRSPTEVPTEVDRVLAGFGPNVVIFDCSGRRSNLRLAHRMGARVVFVSNHARKRWKGFRISRLRYTDDHWILQPRFISGDVTALERMKLRMLRKRDPIFLGPVFPEATIPDHAPHQPFFVCCPGGGGNLVRGRQSGAVFADAAMAVAEHTGLTGLVVTGANFTGELPRHPRLVFHRSLPGAELVGLLGAGSLALVGGGDLLPQTIALRVPAVAAATAGDQPRRIAAYAGAGLCLAAETADLAKVACAAWTDGSLDALAGRLQRSEVRNGLGAAIERITALARESTHGARRLPDLTA